MQLCVYVCNTVDLDIVILCIRMCVILCIRA